MKRKSRIARALDNIPLTLSYAIVLTSWFGFTAVISIYQTFVRRGETLHFALQQSIGNGLFFLTFISLFVASTRRAGSPDPSLQPADIRQPSPPRSPATPVAPLSPEKAVDDDEIPLKFLRNKAWVETRVGKSRPSPLPLRQSMASRQSRNHKQHDDHQYRSAAEQEEGRTGIMSALPLAPSTALEAGEEPARQSTSAGIEGGLEVEPGSGSTPDEADQPLLSAKGRRSIMAKSETGEPRWCRKCDVWKPDRSHHCRYCQRCVLKMDHHCIWIGTCVGFHNYKPFLLFITYGSVAALYVMLEAGRETVRFFQQPDEFYRPEDCSGTTCSDSVDLAPVVSIALAILGGVFLLSVGGLACFHWWLVLNNTTTLENLTNSYPSVLLDDARPTAPAYSKRPVAWKPEHLLTRDERNRLRREAREINVYDLGWRRNLREVFGQTSIWLALWPASRTHRRSDRDAGHFFNIDETKLDSLRSLTRELRQGGQAGVAYGSESESDFDGDFDLDEVEGTPFTPEWPSTGHADDEKSQDSEAEDGCGGSGDRRGDGRRTVAWFEA